MFAKKGGGGYECRPKGFRVSSVEKNSINIKIKKEVITHLWVFLSMINLQKKEKV